LDTDLDDADYDQITEIVIELKNKIKRNQGDRFIRGFSNFITKFIKYCR